MRMMKRVGCHLSTAASAALLLASIQLVAADAVVAPSPSSEEEPWLVSPISVPRSYAESIVIPGKSFEARVPVENRTDGQQKGKLSLTLLDLWETVCGEPRVFDFDLPPKGKAEFKADFAPPRLGVFKVRARVEFGSRSRERDVESFACLPEGNPPFHPFFGAHVGQETGLPELGRRLGFAANRSHDMTQYTWWTRMEPERGQWNKSCLGTYESLDKLGYKQLGTWMTAPYWAVKLPDGSNPPRNDGYPKGWVPTDTEALKNYVRESLAWYPKITEWEIWNEPNVSGFWTGSPQDYAELCRVVYEEAKRVRPDITVYVQFGAEGPWWRDAAKAGLLKHADGVSFHAYATPKDHPQTVLEEITKIKKILADNGRPDMPIIDSEGGLSTSSFLRGTEHPKLPPEGKRDYNFLAAAERMVQWRVVMMAAGVKAHYYYHISPAGLARDTGAGWVPVDVTGAPTPAAAAQCALVWQLDGGAFVRQVERASGLRCYLFQRNDKSITAVLWAEDGAEFTLTRPAPAFDLMGNPIEAEKLPIGYTPLYLRMDGPVDKAAEVLQAAALEVVKAPVAVAAASRDAPAPKRMTSYSVANELGMQRLIPLDLASVANMGLADEKAGDSKGGWMDEGPFNDMSMLAQGRHEWLGVPFQIGKEGSTAPCVVTLKGKTFPAGPDAAGPVAVGRKVRGLFFCHAANWAGGKGKKAATYIINYADGQKAELEVTTGWNLGDWWSDQQEGEDSRTVAQVAKDPLEAKSPYRFLRVWYWENTKSDVPVESVTIKGGSTDVTFVAAGITVAVW